MLRFVQLDMKQTLVDCWLCGGIRSTECLQVHDISKLTLIFRCSSIGLQ